MPSRGKITLGGRRFTSPAQPTARQLRAKKPVPEGKVRCPECEGPVGLRADGSIKGHRIGGLYGYACLGAGRIIECAS